MRKYLRTLSILSTLCSRSTVNHREHFSSVQHLLYDVHEQPDAKTSGRELRESISRGRATSLRPSIVTSCNIGGAFRYVGDGLQRVDDSSHRADEGPWSAGRGPWTGDESLQSAGELVHAPCGCGPAPASDLTLCEDEPLDSTPRRLLYFYSCAVP
jgi:hypothetical protein